MEQSQLELIKLNSLISKGARFYIVATPAIVAMIVKGDHPNIKALPEPIRRQFLAGNAFELSHWMIRQWYKGNLDEKNTWLLDRCEIHLDQHGKFKEAIDMEKN